MKTETNLFENKMAPNFGILSHVVNNLVTSDFGASSPDGLSVEHLETINGVCPGCSPVGRSHTFGGTS